MNTQKSYERERKAMNDAAMREFNHEKALQKITKKHIESIQTKIDEFYMRYATSEGLSKSEAIKRAKDMDVQKFAKKARKAVAEKDFSDRTNEWLKTYNLNMKVSRLELLKQELDWELIRMYDGVYTETEKALYEEAKEEYKRQAGILRNSSTGSYKRVESIVKADFYGKSFSQNIWGRTGYYVSTQKEIFKSLNNIFTTMEGYRAERIRLMNKFETSEYETIRLLRTELARVGSQAQLDAYDENGFTHYVFVTEPGACKTCSPLDNKVLAVKDAEKGVNMKPMHPNCRCSTYGYIPMQRKVNGKWVYEVPDKI